jgi:branched-chain amino acid transport system ATP-binding protein
MTTLLTVRGLRLSHGRIPAVHGIDLDVEEGQVVCLVGANGAGKTTTLRGISGLLRAAAGSIVFAGQPIARLPAHRIARRGLVQVPEGRQIFARMTVAENLRLGAFLVTDGAAVKRRMEAAVALFPRLGERLNQAGGLLSGGEQQMLAMARALMAEPRLLLLDEPSMGLAPLLVEEIFALIARLKAAGRTILLVEQNAGMALEVADYAYVMETGRIRLAGPAPEVAADPRVTAAYLGGA